MRRTHLDDASIALQFRGAGRPVLLIHGTVLADGMLPLADALVASHAHLLVRYHRRGYGESSPITIPWSMEQHAKDAARLIERLGIRKAHVVGHSAGAAVAMELALDFPERVGSLVLVEPWLSDSSDSFTALERELNGIEATYASGDIVAALDNYLRLFCGAHYRKVLEATLPPTWPEFALRDSHTIFLHELGALRLWQLSRSVAERLTKPMLLVRGGETSSYCRQAFDALAEWFPDAQAAVVPNAGHMLPAEQPEKLAMLISRFLAQNPMTISAPAV